MIPRPARPLSWTFVLVTVASCVGAIRGEGEDPSPGGSADRPAGPGTVNRSPSPGAAPGGAGAGGSPPPPTAAPPTGPFAACRVVAPTEIRRLTRGEYDATVRDLLGDKTAPGRAFPEEDGVGSFAVPRAMSAEALDQAVAAAGRLAAAADLTQLLPCKPEGDGASCARQLIARFGRRAFRRPLADDEVGGYEGVYRAVARARDAEAGLRAVIEAMLVSPHFLYRVERGGGPALGDLTPLSPYELATRLAYFLTTTTPADDLLDGAGRGELASEDGVERWARALLRGERGKAAIRSFHDQWLNLPAVSALEKDAALFQAWSRARAAAQEDARRFFEHVYVADGKLESLLGGAFGFSNAALAPIYGAGSGTALARVDLPRGERAGLLTLPAFLATYALDTRNLPVERGKFVREQLFCLDVPAPPENVPELDGSRSSTLRERLDKHRVDPTCNACHALLDPVGLGLEQLDAIGRFRTTESGRPASGRGELKGTDVDGVFDGPRELAGKLLMSRQVRACLAQHWVVFALGRELGADESCVRDGIVSLFEASGGDLRELLVAISRSPVFRYRRPFAGEGGRP